jgi:hypothetical protein
MERLRAAATEVGPLTHALVGQVSATAYNSREIPGAEMEPLDLEVTVALAKEAVIPAPGNGYGPFGHAWGPVCG